MKICTCHQIEAQSTSEIAYPFEVGHLCVISGRQCDVEEIEPAAVKLME